MRGILRRSALLLTSATFALGLSFAAARAQGGEPTYQYDIPAESLSQALTDFSQASSQQIIYLEDSVRGKNSSGLHGRYTAAKALQLLLTGTDLKSDTNQSGVLMVQSKNVQAASNDGADQGRTN